MNPPPSSSPAGSEPPAELEFPAPDASMDWTGERFVSGLGGEIRLEHHHRYLAAAPLCVGRDVLDIASGEGFGSAMLARVARSVVGVDRDADAVAFANEHYRCDRGTLRFAVGECARIPLEDGSVDVVVSFETIEHIGEHDRFLDEVRRVLRPGGLFVCSTPDRDVYRSGDDPNEFHQKELNAAEFGGLMRDRFARVEVYGQRIVAGSWLLPVDREDARAPGVYTTDDGRRYTHSPGLPDPVYLLAVCTDGPAPRFAPSGVSHERLRPREIDRLGARLRAEEARSAAEAAKARTAAAVLAKKSEEAGRLAEQLGEARADSARHAEAVEAARKQADAARADAERLTEQVKAGSERQKSDAAALQEAQRDLRAARRQLELAVERERRLVSQRDEARTAANLKERDTERANRELDQALERERRLLEQRDRARAEAAEASRGLASATGRVRTLESDLERNRLETAQLSEDIATMSDRLAAAAERERDLGAGLERARLRADALSAELRTLRASRSWRFTAPLRAVGRMFRGKPVSDAEP